MKIQIDGLENLVKCQRNKFNLIGIVYPEIEWADLSHEQKLIKDATIEMFLKTLELIGTFHPYLSAGELLEVERKMAIIKKIPFEKWVKKSFAKKARLLENEKENFKEKDFLVAGGNGSVLKIPTSSFAFNRYDIYIIIHWMVFGISKNSCNPYFEQNSNLLN